MAPAREPKRPVKGTGKEKTGRQAVAGDPKMESFKQQLIDPAKLLNKNKNPKMKQDEVIGGAEQGRNAGRPALGEGEENSKTQKLGGTEMD